MSKYVHPATGARTCPEPVNRETNMITIKSLFSIVAMLCVVSLLSETAMGSKNARMTINWGGFAETEETVSEEPALLVGSTAEIVVKILAPTGEQPPYRGVNPGWPEGLEVEMEIGTLKYKASDQNRGIIGIQPYLTSFQKMQDSLWRASGREPSIAHSKQAYHFAFPVDAELLGQRLCFSATYLSEEWGELETDSPICLNVRTATNENEENSVRLSLVGYADATGDFTRAISLADSLVQQGWRSPLGLSIATRSAVRARLWKQALDYLELNYETNGVVSLSQGKLNEDEKRSEYQRIRQDFLDKEGQQQR